MSILQGDEVFYSESFISQHSPQNVIVLEELREELLAFKNANKNQ
jgi:hypothetical protein